MKANNLSNFVFKRTGNGQYKVHYFTPKRGDYWVAIINDMSLIDRTLYADWAKAKDIAHLKWVVQMKGTHYHNNGEPFGESFK